jgi:hypothetical protein
MTNYNRKNKIIELSESLKMALNVVKTISQLSMNSMQNDSNLNADIIFTSCQTIEHLLPEKFNEFLETEF